MVLRRSRVYEPTHRVFLSNLAMMRPGSVTEDRSTTHAGVIASAHGGTVLPRYTHPPVVEVAISVQFDELTQFELVHFGLLWERLRDRYPRTEHHPPLPALVELFSARGPQGASLRFEEGFPIGRCWYLSEDRLRLIQVQPDRFI